jgi:hypothetical protein
MREHEYDDGIMEPLDEMEEISALDDDYHEEDIYEEHNDEEPISAVEPYGYNCDQVDMARKALLERSKKRAKLSEDYQTKQYADNFKIMG